MKPYIKKISALIRGDTLTRDEFVAHILLLGFDKAVNVPSCRLYQLFDRHHQAVIFADLYPTPHVAIDVGSIPAGCSIVDAEWTPFQKHGKALDHILKLLSEVKK